MNCLRTCTNYTNIVLANKMFASVYAALHNPSFQVPAVDAVIMKNSITLCLKLPDRRKGEFLAPVRSQHKS